VLALRIAVRASARLNIVQHLVLDFVLESIDKALASMERFAVEVCSALG
jgi:hypothetical protein